jgi:hypothetical protein
MLAEDQTDIRTHYEIAKSDCYLRDARPSDRVELHGSYGTDFHEI